MVVSQVKSNKPAANPLQTGITRFVSACAERDPDDLSGSHIPKRYTRYGSFLVLGPTFFTHSPVWETFYRSLASDERKHLFQCIAKAFNGGVTHIAANAPIALQTVRSDGADAVSSQDVEENVIRSPAGLVPLYGEFGPSDASSDGSSLSPLDFNQTFWAETTQLRNIVQVWAPRWTMFSRGNIKEKARILQDDSLVSPFPGLSTIEMGEEPGCVDVVDFYIGIGYFAFCYLSRGVRRVWGWDLNGWSIEGLRRGCIKNGWNVKVVRITESGNFADEEGAAGLVRQIQSEHLAGNDVRCIAFWGDNTWASKIMHEIQEAFLNIAAGLTPSLKVRHCNLGLLPTSRKSWSGALAVLAKTGGWLHVHENSDMSSIEGKQQEIVQQLQQQVLGLTTSKWSISCEHVEKVKTYAPGVMHCVFDIKIYPS